MAQSTNNYDKLYNSMKENLTVTNGDCSLGEYMLMKAAAKKAEDTLPVPVRPSVNRAEKAAEAAALVYTYVEDKLSVKHTPEKDTVIRAFPLRTSGAAILAAMVICTLLISLALIGSKVTTSSRLDTLDAADVEVEEVVDTATVAKE